METVKRLVMNPPPAIGYRELTELHSVAMQSMMGMRHEPLTVKDVGTFIIAWTSDNISSALPVCFVHALSEEAQIVVLTQTVGGQLEVLVLPMAKLIKYARTTASHPSENLDHAIRPAENEIVFFGSNYLLKEFCQVDETTRLSTITAAQSIGAKRNGFLFEIWYGETRWVFYRTLNSFDRIVHTSLYSCLPSLKKAYNTHIECLHCLLPGDQVWLSSPEDFLNSLIAIVEEKLIPQNFEEFTYQVDKIMIPKSTLR